MGLDVEPAQELRGRKGPVLDVGAEDGGGLLTGEDLLGVQTQREGLGTPVVPGDRGPCLGVGNGLSGHGVVLVGVVLVGHANLDTHGGRRAAALDEGGPRRGGLRDLVHMRHPVGQRPHHDGEVPRAVQVGGRGELASDLLGNEPRGLGLQEDVDGTVPADDVLGEVPHGLLSGRRSARAMKTA